jgi:prepilin-type N-terminal cleavage/methylation domain-containing protein/prepilin-type processing-associated H-X9-DG protein
VRRSSAFTLIEVLVVITIVVVIAALFLPALNAATARARSLICLGNLKQWGVATQFYVLENEDYLPPEGSPSPGRGMPAVGWYVDLPAILGVSPYGSMPWRTNAAVRIGRSLFICPANSRRATNHNLFHYCYNQHIDGTGVGDRPVRFSAIRAPSRLVQLFDNGGRAAVAQQNNVHTNLHQEGAQFLFLDGHTRRFGNRVYWDFQRNRGRTNSVDLVWRP